MKKQPTSTNRTAPHTSMAHTKLTVLADAALAEVKGGGGPQSPDLYPVTNGGDSGPTS